MGLFKSKHPDMAEIAARLAAADPPIVDEAVDVDALDDASFAAAIAAAREADAAQERRARDAAYAVSA